MLCGETPTSKHFDYVIIGELLSVVDPMVSGRRGTVSHLSKYISSAVSVLNRARPSGAWRPPPAFFAHGAAFVPQSSVSSYSHRQTLSAWDGPIFELRLALRSNIWPRVSKNNDCHTSKTLIRLSQEVHALSVPKQLSILVPSRSAKQL